MRAGKRGLRAAVLLLLGFSFFVGAAQAGQPGGGTVAPPFTLQDLDGNDVSLSDYRRAFDLIGELLGEQAD